MGAKCANVVVVSRANVSRTIHESSYKQVITVKSTVSTQRFFTSYWCLLWGHFSCEYIHQGSRGLAGGGDNIQVQETPAITLKIHIFISFDYFKV
jgi:hypothetical protein